MFVTINYFQEDFADFFGKKSPWKLKMFNFWWLGSSSVWKIWKNHSSLINMDIKDHLILVSTCEKVFNVIWLGGLVKYFPFRSSLHPWLEIKVTTLEKKYLTKPPSHYWENLLIFILKFKHTIFKFWFHLIKFRHHRLL